MNHFNVETKNLSPCTLLDIFSCACSKEEKKERKKLILYIVIICFVHVIINTFTGSFAIYYDVFVQ